VAAGAGWGLAEAPGVVPAVLVQWLDKPTPWDGLGHEILKEIGGQVPVPGYSVW